MLFGTSSLRITVAAYFKSFESIIVYRSTRRAGCWTKKAQKICIWEFRAVTFVKANWLVCAILYYLYSLLII